MILIIGFGRLGQYFYNYLKRKGLNVKVYSRSIKEIEENEFSKFKYAILAIPENSYNEILSKLKENNFNGVIIDLASKKDVVIPIIEQYGFKFLSLHPLFGPSIYEEFSKIVVIKESTDKSFLQFLDFDLIEMSLEEHEKINELQVVTHLLLISYYHFARRFPIKTASAEALYRLSERLLEQNPQILLDIQKEKNAKTYRENYIKFLKEVSNNIEDYIPKERVEGFSRALLLNLSKLWNKDIRKQIMVIDKLILDLIKIRNDLAKQIKEIKELRNLPIEDKKWEIEKRNILLEFAKERELNPLYTDQLIELLISWAKHIENPKPWIGVLGPIGSFSDEVALKLNKTRLNIKYYRKISHIFDALENNEIALGIVPIENVLGGSVNETLDSLIKYNVKIVGEYIHRINLCLVGKNVKEVKRIISHPQAIAQSMEYISKKFPNAEIVYSNSTSEAISMLDEYSLAITSKTAAIFYGLKIYDEHIEDNKENKTRFIIIGKKQLPNPKYSALVFSLEDKPGSLKEVLEIFHKHNINLRKLESRPDKREIGKYLFYVESDLLNNKILEEIRAKANWVKHLGNFREINEIEFPKILD